MREIYPIKSLQDYKRKINYRNRILLKILLYSVGIIVLAIISMFLVDLLKNAAVFIGFLSVVWAITVDKFLRRKEIDERLSTVKILKNGLKASKTFLKVWLKLTSEEKSNLMTYFELNLRPFEYLQVKKKNKKVRLILRFFSLKKAIRNEKYNKYMTIELKKLKKKAIEAKIDGFVESLSVLEIKIKQLIQIP